MNKRNMRIFWGATLLVLGLALGIGGVLMGFSIVDAQQSAPNEVVHTEFLPGTVMKDIEDVLPQLATKIESALLVSSEPDQTVFDNLTVEEDERIDGNVVVYNGNVRVKDGGKIAGDLVVYNGNIRVDEEGSIQGNASTFSGNIRIAGKIGGNLTTWNGDIDLQDSSVVNGDVSVLNGEVKRADGAKIGGNTVRGPNLELPEMPKAPFNFGEPKDSAVNAVASSAPSVFAKFGRLLLRSISMVILAIVAGIVVWLFTQVRPETIKRTQTTLSEQAAISFVVGIVVNVILLMIGGFFAITICLLPVALVAYLLLFGINVIGWAGLSATISDRLMKRYSIDAPWQQVTAVTAMLFAAVFGLLWAFGGCFRFFGFAGMLVMSSAGAGAVLMPFLHKHLGLGDSTDSTSGNPGSRGVSTRVTDVELAQDDYIVEQSIDDAVADTDTGQTSESRPDVAVPVDDSAVDALLSISGLGPVAAERLRSAGVTSVAILAQMSDAEIGAILRWSPDRVQQAQIVEQAKALSK